MYEQSKIQTIQGHFYGDGRSAASTSLQQQHSNSKKTLYTTAMSARADSTTSACTLLLAVY